MRATVTALAPSADLTILFVAEQQQWQTLCHLVLYDTPCTASRVNERDHVRKRRKERQRKRNIDRMFMHMCEWVTPKAALTSSIRILLQESTTKAMPWASLKYYR